MTDELIEKIARALHDLVMYPADYNANLHVREFRTDCARAALAAIEESGTHKIVPANYEITLVGDMDVTEWLLHMAEQPENELYSFSLESAADEITRLRTLLGVTA